MGQSSLLLLFNPDKFLICHTFSINLAEIYQIFIRNLSEYGSVSQRVRREFLIEIITEIKQIRYFMIGGYHNFIR